MNLATMAEPADTDLDLLARWRGGDARAGDALSRRHHAALRQFFRTKARPEDLDDLVQQVWLALGEARGGVQTTLRGYLYGIARHVLFAHLRGKYRAGTVDPISSSITALDPSLSQVVGERVAAERMMLALQGLPVDTQILLELRYFNSMSTAELATLYEVPAGTIKSRLFHARKLLEAGMDGALSPARARTDS
jgi:RNA polymerase sigma factor (sigma-70 family)